MSGVTPNRALPDNEIEAFVDSLARRLASFEKHALVGAKALMNEVTLPPDAVFQHALSAFFASTAHPGTRARGASLIQRPPTSLRHGIAAWPDSGGCVGAAYERPGYFAYRVSNPSFALKHLMSHAGGEWWFEPAKGEHT